MATMTAGQVTDCPKCGAGAVFAVGPKHTAMSSSGQFRCTGCFWTLWIRDGLPAFKKSRARGYKHRAHWPTLAAIAYRKAMVRRFPMVEGTPMQAHNTVIFDDVRCRWGRMAEERTYGVSEGSGVRDRLCDGIQEFVLYVEVHV